MKNTKKARGLTMTALALALGAAVYLNWSFAQNAPQTVSVGLDGLTAEASASAADIVTDGTNAATAVFDPLEQPQEATAAAEQDTANKNYGEAQLVSVNKDSGSEFFEAARLSRSKTRDEALDTIKSTLKNADLSEEEKTDLTGKLQKTVSNITVESALETIIKAKGFADCVVMLGDEKVNVTVMTENDALSADEVTRIRDVILAKCKGMKAQNITVVEVK